VIATVESKLHKHGVLKYELLLLVVTMIWGPAFVAQQIGMEKGVGPMTFNGLRFALGCLSLIPIIIWRKKTIGNVGEAGKPWCRGSVAAGLFLFAAASFQQVGLQYTSSANAGFITALYIAFVPLIGLWFGQRAGKGLWAGIAVGLVGFYLLSVAGKFVISRGDLLILISAGLWACQILAIDRIAGLQFVVCAALSTLFGLLFERCTLQQVKAASGAVAYAGIMSVGVAYTLQVVCQRRCPAAPAAVIMSMEAVLAALAGYIVLDQALTGRAIVGCCLILCGVLIVQLGPMLSATLEAASLTSNPKG